MDEGSGFDRRPVAALSQALCTGDLPMPPLEAGPHLSKKPPPQAGAGWRGSCHEGALRMQGSPKGGIAPG